MSKYLQHLVEGNERFEKCKHNLKWQGCSLDISVLRSERCKNCKHCRIITAQDGWMFSGCTHEPYHGMWVIEIENCPLVQIEE